MNTMGIIALLAFVACANAGLIGHPALLHAHGHYLAGPVVKHIHPEIYAVPPPILAKPVVYAPPPVVKVLHAAPVVKTLSIGPLGYGAYGDPYLHHHHHAHGYHGVHGFHGHPFLF